MLCFLDLETTGLDENAGSILEIGLIVTEDDLTFRGLAHDIVKPLFNHDNMDDFVTNMHTKNGLLEELKTKNPKRRYEVELEMCEWLADYPDGLIMAGNTVHFDKQWLRVHMPKLHSKFHYRILDVTSLNEFAKRFDKELWDNRPGANGATAHRALADARQSLETVRYYSGMDYV